MTEQKRICLHEAGHAVLAIAENIGLNGLSIDHDGGSCWFEPSEDLHPRLGAAFHLAGVVAESLAGFDTTAAGDRYADDYAKVAQCTPATSADEVIGWASDYARQKLREHWPAVKRIAAALEAGGVLSADEVKRLFNQRKETMKAEQPKPKRKKRPAIQIDPALFAPKFSSRKGHAGMRIKARV